jgi:uncharacterized protein (DUF2384 family)
MTVNSSAHHSKMTDSHQNFARQAQLDGYAFDAFEDLGVARRWIETPCDALGGLTPTDAAQSDDGLENALALLAQIRITRLELLDQADRNQGFKRLE